MRPYTEDEFLRHFFLWGTVFTLTRNNNGTIETFILEPEEVKLEGLQNE